MNKSLSTRLMYSFMTIIVIVVVGITAGTSYLIADYFFKIKEDELAQKGHDMADTVEYFVTKDNNRYMLMRYLIAVDHLVGARIWLFDNEYNLLAASNIAADVDSAGKTAAGSNGEVGTGKPDVSVPADRIPVYEYTTRLAEEIKSGQVSRNVNKILKDIYRGESVRSQIYHPYFKQQVILVGVPYGDKYHPRGAILMAEPLSGFGGFLRSVYIFTIIVGLLGLVLSLFMVRKLSRQIVKPLVSMKNATIAIAKGNYSRRVEVEGEDEVAELGDAINHLSTELSNYLGKLARMEKIRRDFVANVSHELRTPITIIRGYNDIVSDSLAEDDPNKRYCDLIGSETKRLERLVRGLLDISRLQSADKLKVSDTQPLPLTEIIRNVAEKLKVKAEPKQITLKLQLEEDLEIMGNGDQIVQLVLLLGDNAIKYSPRGSYVRYETKQLANGSIEMSVVDNGPGIPEEDLPFIFERFYKVDKSHAQSSSKGTGLGLAIAKEIVRMHGAHIEVFSRVNVGTRFVVTFPAEAVIREEIQS
ncbi:Signal transduction histidine kinase [Succiniclasticum ruminis]|uniref:histidine kinase n=1 Tax=Succiniclasticum ruminis TaxID=40841 RepID=A0A1G6N6Q6_9FIRM|nr:HAMP domain-containing sensor histidine kinase [Succiniclasticum ruminis]SDC63077.1 Signal transduction histidine kinase [Succiniclasticum ruminis]